MFCSHSCQPKRGPPACIYPPMAGLHRGPSESSCRRTHWPRVTPIARGVVPASGGGGKGYGWPGGAAMMGYSRHREAHRRLGGITMKRTAVVLLALLTIAGPAQAYIVSRSEERRVG